MRIPEFQPNEYGMMTGGRFRRVSRQGTGPFYGVGCCGPTLGAAPTSTRKPAPATDPYGKYATPEQITNNALAQLNVEITKFNARRDQRNAKYRKELGDVEKQINSALARLQNLLKGLQQQDGQELNAVDAHKTQVQKIFAAYNVAFEGGATYSIPLPMNIDVPVMRAR